ncbi:microtubule-associated protein RP/EB family member 1-like [Lucilia sericata]|uniref:microtubule-associated protein RP/EB family member 1-like n=1 Tax=Lucilia sericata TaxID=13632 RepID=UPI0018A8100F|nr:microtubule-associated protein RP/EB family member 1-like [Lucilia sericata]
MPDLKTTVTLTSATAEKMSRHDMLEWVNSTVHGQYKKIEELCSGVAYCQMMELLFPNTVGLKKIKCNAKLEHEFLHNLKLFQAAFIKLNFDKSVPIDRLIKGKFQDNFEFLQWFKKFFDTHSAGKENLKVPAALAAATHNAPKPIRKPGTQPLGGAGATSKSATTKSSEILKTPKSGQQHDERMVSPSSLRVLQETKEELNKQTLSIEQERNTYYKKLTEIEAILHESIKNEVYVDWCNRALAILYAVDDNAPPGDEEEGAEAYAAETADL